MINTILLICCLLLILRITVVIRAIERERHAPPPDDIWIGKPGNINYWVYKKGGGSENTLN